MQKILFCEHAADVFVSGQVEKKLGTKKRLRPPPLDPASGIQWSVPTMELLFHSLF